MVWGYICVFYVQSTECILLFNEANFDNTHLWMNPARILNTLLVITVDKNPPILSLLFSFDHYGSSSRQTEYTRTFQYTSNSKNLFSCQDWFHSSIFCVAHGDSLRMPDSSEFLNSTRFMLSRYVDLCVTTSP